MVQTRGPTGSLRRVTIGRDTKMTAEAARRAAAEVIDRISSGEDPFPAPPTPEPTVADLAERYMKAHVEVNCRPGTLPVIGKLLDHNDIETRAPALRAKFLKIGTFTVGIEVNALHSWGQTF